MGKKHWQKQSINFGLRMKHGRDPKLENNESPYKSKKQGRSSLLYKKHATLL